MDRFNPICGEALANIRYDRNTAGDGRIKSNRATQFPRAIKKFCTIFREKRLVCGDHVFSTLKQLNHYASSGFDSSDQLDHAFDLVAFGDFFQPISEYTLRKLDIPRLIQVTDDCLLEPNGPAGMPRGAFTVV